MFQRAVQGYEPRCLISSASRAVVERRGFDPTAGQVAMGAFVVASLAAALYIANGWLRVWIAEIPHPPLEIVTRLLLLFWIWVPLAPLVWWAARKWPIAPPFPPRRIALHLMLGVAAFAAHAFAYWSALQLRAAAGIAPVMLGVNFPPAQMRVLVQLRQLVVLADTDFIIYGIIVAAATISRNHTLAIATRTWRDRVESRRSSALLEALRRQLRPHFVLNALNTALSELTVRPARARAVLTDLAELVESTERLEGDLIALDAELAIVRAHAAIEQARFSDRLTVEWRIAAGADQVQVPPFSIQTLFENAVRHGLERSSGPFTIKVEVERVSDGCCIRVCDSGGRIRKGESSGAGIALANLRSRIALLFGSRAHLTLKVEQGWTVAELKVPGAFK